MLGRLGRFLGVCLAVTVGLGEIGQAEEVTGKAGQGERLLRLGEILVEVPKLDRDLLSTPTLESASLEIATSVVDASTLRFRDAGNLVDALEFAPGVFVEERGRKEKQLVSYRGQIYPYPDFAFNGVWQRSFWEVPSFVPAGAIERVEILRSGGAIMVGPNSGLVGAINVVPRRFDEPTTLLDAQMGTDESVRSWVVHGDRDEETYYTVGAGWNSTAGPDDENAAEHFASFFGTAGLMPTEGLHLELTGFALEGERELRLIQDPGMNGFKSRYEEFSPYRSIGGNFRALLEHSDRASTELDFGYMRRSVSYERDNNPSRNARELDWEYNAGVLHAVNLSDANTLRLGLQYNHWVCPEGKRFFVGRTMNVQTFSGVIMDEHRFDRLTLDAGLRLTRTWYRDYTDANFSLTGANMKAGLIEDEWGDPAVTATFGAKYDVAPSLALYSHAAAGTVDAPPAAVSEDGSDIERESRAILDGGLRYEVDGRGVLQVGGFMTHRTSAVLLSETQTTVAGDTYNTYANADVRQYGIEIEAHSALIREHYTAYTTATFMNSQRRIGGGWSSHAEIPDQIVTAGLRAEFGGLDINLFGRYVGAYANKRFAQDGNYHDLGDFADLNVNAGYSFGKDKSTRVYCTVENLLDDEYSTVVGFPDYGLQIFVGLQHEM